jgi:hypothetical protein
VFNDPGKSEEFRLSEHWFTKLLDMRVVIPQSDEKGKFKSHSLSGNERNRLLIGGKKGFKDRSLVSGVDSREDARSYALLDYDKDGWVDIALPSINGQRLRLFRNRFGDLGAKGRVVEVSLQGANTESLITALKSNRDAIGAILTVITDKTKRVYRRSIGEGMAAQNSGRIRVTLAEGEILQSLSVRWPSGKTTKIKPTLDQLQIKIQE